MKICENGVIRDMTPEEEAELRRQDEEATREYWSVPYDEAVNREIRIKYPESAEFAILRQKEEKQKEYRDYYDYCEHCKVYCKEMIAKYNPSSNIQG